MKTTREHEYLYMNEYGEGFWIPNELSPEEAFEEDDFRWASELELGEEWLV